LRLRDDLAREYAALKVEAVTPHVGDREAYTAAKTELVRRVLTAHS
jgi:GrpB-like predicted nucleotidyltransferase (UPF0157 family)